MASKKPSPQTNIASPHGTLLVASIVLILVLGLGVAGAWYAFHAWVKPSLEKGKDIVIEQAGYVKEQGEEFIGVGVGAKEKIDSGVDTAQAALDAAKKTKETVSDIANSLDALIDTTQELQN